MISKGIKLSYKNGEAAAVELTNLQEIPNLGGDTEAIDITTLADVGRKYEDGIKNYGEGLPFKFLYEADQFNQLVNLKGENGWIVSLPDSTSCEFDGTCSVKLDGVGVNAALTYTLTVKPTSEMVWA